MDGLRLNSIHPYPSLHAAAWAGFFAASVGSAAADAASAAVAAAASTIVDLVIFTICVLCAYFVSSSSSLRTSWSWSSCPFCSLLVASCFPFPCLAWLGLAYSIASFRSDLFRGQFGLLFVVGLKINLAQD